MPFVFGGGGSSGTGTNNPAQTVAVATTNPSNATTSYVDATNMGISIVNGGTYIVEAFIVWQSTSTTVGIAFALNGPTASKIAYHVHWTGSSSSVQNYQAASTYDHGGAATTAVAAANTDYTAQVRGIIVATADGTLIPRFKSSTTTAVSVRAGSTFRVTRVA